MAPWVAGDTVDRVRGLKVHETRCNVGFADDDGASGFETSDGAGTGRSDVGAVFAESPGGPEIRDIEAFLDGHGQTEERTDPAGGPLLVEPCRSDAGPIEIAYDDGVEVGVTGFDPADCVVRRLGGADISHGDRANQVTCGTHAVSRSPRVSGR